MARCGSRAVVLSLVIQPGKAGYPIFTSIEEALSSPTWACWYAGFLPSVVSGYFSKAISYPDCMAVGEGAIRDQIQKAPTFFPRAYGCYGPDTLNYCAVLGQDVSVPDENGNLIRVDMYNCVLTSMGGCRILLENNGLVFRTGITHPDKTTPIEMYGDSIKFYIRRQTNCAIRLINETGQTRPGYLAEIEPDKSVANLRAEVTCDGVPTDASVRLEAQVEENSGGHRHHDTRRPNGSLGGAPPNENVLTGNTGTNGLTFTFGAPAVSGDHILTARCTDRDCGSDSGRVWVGIKNLKLQANSPNYVLLPNRDTNHPGNHYVMSNTEKNLANFAAAYHEKFPNDPVLHFNDASVERGGLFDIDSNWQLPHETHRLGRNVDVQANEFYHDPSQSIPSWNYIDFWNMGANYGCYVALHSGATPNEHFHLHCL